MTDRSGTDLVSLYSTGELSAEFWGGLAEGKLLIPWCNSCEAHFFYPRRACPTCWSDDLEFRESPGRGAIFAISELHTAFQGISKDELPVAVLLVELDEGVRLPGRLAKNSMPASVGDRVELKFAADPSVELPKFEKTK